MVKFNHKIKDSDERKHFITSDLHFYHSNILKFAPEYRPYSDVNEMNNGLIEKWNETVGENDIVFHLGDFSFKQAKETQSILDKLNGHIVWVCGNHDVKLFDNMNIPYHHYLEVRFEGFKIVMCHYPLGSWNSQCYGSLHAHGHSHGSYGDNKGRMHDVGWDNNGKILTLSEFVDITSSKEIYTADSHGGRNEV